MRLASGDATNATDVTSGQPLMKPSHPKHITFCADVERELRDQGATSCRSVRGIGIGNSKLFKTGSYHEALSIERLMMFDTATGDQGVPRALRTPRALSARATPRSDVTPLA
jgi:hypothetical protein